MSVLVLDVKVFEAIATKLEHMRNHQQIDINYCSVVSNLADKESIQNLIKKWCYLNELTYNRRYQETVKTYLKDFIDFSKYRMISTVQLYKYIQCLDYNIEKYTIEKGYSDQNYRGELAEDLVNAINMLKAIETGLANTIACNHRDYEKCKWSDF